MTFIKQKLDAHLNIVESDHVIVHNVTLGLHEAIRAPGFDKSMTNAQAKKAIAKLNADRYLGFDNWRLSQPWEGLTQVAYVNEGVMADLDLYPDMQGAPYWTGQDVPWSSGCVFCVSFLYGGVGALTRDSRAFVRPVRSMSASQ